MVGTYAKRLGHSCLILFLASVSTLAIAAAPDEEAGRILPGPLAKRTAPDVLDADDAGARLWVIGRHADAVAVWKAAIATNRDGAVQAAYGLGLAYHRGQGATVNRDQAIAMFRRAAKSGYAPAVEQMGLMLAERPDSHAEAIGALDRAARLGQPLSQYLMGLAYANGDQVPVNRPLAAAFLERAWLSGMLDAKPALTRLRDGMTMAERGEADRLSSLIVTSRQPDAHAAQGGAPVPVPIITSVTKIEESSPTSARPVRAEPVMATASVAKPLVSAKARPLLDSPLLTGRWQVQLGAYSSISAARAAWRRLSASRSDSLHSRAPNYAPAGQLTRLRVRGLPDARTALTLCTRLRTGGTPCFVLAPEATR